jgi:ABC-type transport system, involved in lipoprotein release, permease component
MSEFVRFIALRYFTQSHRKHTLSLISLISVLGLSLGVATLIIVLSVMDGLIAKTEEIVLKSTTHANVYRLIGNFDTYTDVQKQVESIPGVLGATPVVFREVLLMSEKGLATAFLNGIEPEGYKKISDLSELVIEGDYECLGKKEKCGYVEKNLSKMSEMDDFLGEESQLFPVILGVDLAQKLQVSPGALISLVTSGSRKIVGEDAVPVSGNLVVAGIFESGMYDYDSRYLYAGLEETQTLLDIGKNVSFVSTKVDEPGKILDFRSRMTERVGGFPFAVQDWRDLHKTTFKFFHLQKLIMFIILVFIAIVASFGIITTLIMLVIDKTREVSILRSVGAKKSVIRGIFMFDGFIIGLLGTILGSVLAAVICLLLKNVEFQISKEIYFFSTLPVQLSFGTFAVVIFSTLLISVAATLYPSIKASGITPVEGLRHE